MDEARAAREGRPSDDPDGRQWSCGVNSSIKKGARLFLHKQGDPPRGVVGSAWATSDVFEAPHYDDSRAAKGDKARYVGLRILSEGRAEGRGEPTNDALACHEFCYEMRPGDYVIAKAGVDQVLGIGIVTSGYVHEPSRVDYKNVRRVRWLVTGDLRLPPKRHVHQKTLTDITRRTDILDYIRAHLPWDDKGGCGGGVIDPEPYTIDGALEGVFIARPEFEAILAAWRRKRNAILSGPPGVGKTFVAKRLAYALMGTKDPSRVAMVQFHPSYAYEDFVQGWRPKEAGGFELRNGVFYDFCRRAAADPRGRPHVFVIDEINRGNLSRILGELMLLIEHDHRGPAFAIPLTYSRDAADRFYVPENVYVLGLMNTADRSLAMVDYALRRRFCFTQLRPAFHTDAFRVFLASHGVEDAVIDRIVTGMTELNGRIAEDKNLGRGFEVGHSFFCPGDADLGNGALGRDWHAAVVAREIAPLLREYWFEDLDLADELAAKLLKGPAGG